jgi:DNA-binding transcriptional ArsR family regulator
MLNAVFKALKDPTRRAILEQLKDGDRSAGEIAGAFAISKPSISNHLELLCQAGLTVRYRQGQYIYYTLNATVVEELIGWCYQLADAQHPTNRQSKEANNEEANTPQQS